MHLLLMLVVILAFYPETPSATVADAALNILWTGLGMVAVWLSAALPCRMLELLIRRQPHRRSRWGRWFSTVRIVHSLTAVGVYLVMLFVFQWGFIVRANWGLNGAVLIDELLVLAPFLISLILGWSESYRVERAMRDTGTALEGEPFWNQSEYVLFHVRHYLGLVLAPILIFLAVHDSILWVAPGIEKSEWSLAIMMGFMALTLLFFMPWLLAKIWGAHSLPSGPLRDRLEAVARRLKFRHTDILLWNTRGGIVNAMVTGILPTPRYVLLSDGLINDLNAEEVEAVFGHEIGHVKHGHMPLYLGFMLLSLGLLIFCMPPLELNTADWSFLFGFATLSWSVHLFAVAMLGGYVWLVFGFLSRRCERQADVYGCKAVSCSKPDCQGHEWAIEPTGDSPRLCQTGIRIFIHALEKVASLNGIRRDKPSWRHSSIARRVAFLENLLINPARERRFQLRLFLVKCALFISLSAAFGGALWYNYSQSDQPAAKFNLDSAFLFTDLQPIE